jgi:hypothetical protein
MKKILYAFAMLSGVLAYGAKVTLTYDSNGSNSGFTPTMNRVSEKDTIITYNTYTVARTLNVEFPNLTTKNVSIPAYGSDTTILTQNGAHIFNMGGINAYVMTYQESTININYNNNLQKFQPDPVNLKLFDKITITYTSNAISGVTLLDPNNISTNVTVNPLFSPGNPITISKTGTYTLKLAGITSSIVSSKLFESTNTGNGNTGVITQVVGHNPNHKTDFISTDSLILHLPFKDGVASDYSKYHLTASTGGSTTVTMDPAGRAAQALLFTPANSSNVAVSNNTALNLTNQVSVSLWFNSTSISSAQRLVDKIVGGNTGYILLDIYQSKPRFFVGATNLSPNHVLESNKWYLITATCDGTTAKLYINGALIGSAAFTGSISNNTSTLYIGRDQSGNNKFNGSIDDVRMYKRALSENEISNLYDESILWNLVDTPNMLAYLKFSNSTLDEVSNQLAAVNLIQYVNDRHQNATSALNVYNSTVFMTLPNVITSDSVTVCFWYRPTNLVAANYYTFFSTKVDVGDAPFVINNNKVGYFGTGTSGGFNGSITLANDNYYFMTMTKKGSDIKLYINNTLQASGNNASTMAEAPIGEFFRNTAAASQTPTGIFDDIMIYNRILSSDELYQIYTAPNESYRTSIVTALDQIEEKSNDGFVYPNPATDFINVSDYSQVFDIQGNKVAEGEGKINISTLEKGVYLIKSGNGNAKFIKD